MMRAVYPGALQIKRYEHRSWAVDVVIYDDYNWVALCFPPGSMESQRLAPFSHPDSAFSAAKLHIDEVIRGSTVEPPKPKGTKRPKRKKKKDPA